MVQKLTNKEATTTTTCSICGKEIILDDWEFRRRSKNKRGIFCSIECNYKNRSTSIETRQKISQSQKGKSFTTRGRPGHIVTEETKQKIRDTKKKNALYRSPDWDIVEKAVADLKLKRYALTKAPVPDIIYIEDGRLVAVEVEKKIYETDIRKKMDNHNLTVGYDKVIIMWYLPTGEFMKQWIWENGIWTLTLG